MHLIRGVPGPPGGVPAQVPPLWTEWLTDRCKNITLPQTSFAGGNKFYSNEPRPHGKEEPYYQRNKESISVAYL